MNTLSMTARSEMKRLTETEKWDDPWFRSLSPPQKLVFLYVVDRCNNAGFLEIDHEAMTWHTKLTPDELQAAIKGLVRGLRCADGWVWVRTFLRHQKHDDLSLSNPANRQLAHLIKEQMARFEKVDGFADFIAPIRDILDRFTGLKKKGGGGKLPTTEAAKRIAAIFHRQLSTEWSDPEVTAFKKLAPFDLEALGIVEAYYKAERGREKSICRTALITFLNNYQGEVDRARAWASRNPRLAAKKPAGQNGDHEPQGFRAWAAEAYPGLPPATAWNCQRYRDEWQATRGAA